MALLCICEAQVLTPPGDQIWGDIPMSIVGDLKITYFGVREGLRTLHLPLKLRIATIPISKQYELDTQASEISERSDRNLFLNT